MQRVMGLSARKASVQYAREMGQFCGGPTAEPMGPSHESTGGWGQPWTVDWNMTPAQPSRIRPHENSHWAKQHGSRDACANSQDLQEIKEPASLPSPCPHLAPGQEGTLCPGLPCWRGECGRSVFPRDLLRSY